MAAAAPWQAPFEFRAAEVGGTIDFYTPFARAPFRLLVFLVLAPTLLSAWGEEVTGLVLATLALRLVVVRGTQSWAAVVRRRARAHVTVGDAASSASTQLAAAALSAFVALVAIALGHYFAGTLSALLTHGLPYPALDVESFLVLEGVNLALWPLLAALAAMGDAHLTAKEQAHRAGQFGLAQAALAMAIPALGLAPIWWPASGLFLTAISLFALLASQLGRLRGARFEVVGTEVGRLVAEMAGTTWGDAGALPVLCLAILPSVALHGPKVAVVPLALALLAGLVAESVAEVGGSIEPVALDSSLYSDVHRARWRFRRMLDSAALVAFGAALLLAVYGPGLTLGWLRLAVPSRLLVAAMAVFVIASAGAGVAASWLRRSDRPGIVAILVRLDLLLCGAVAVVLAGSGVGWQETALAVVAIHALVGGIGLTWAASSGLGIDPGTLALGRLWRYGLVVLPAGIAAGAVSTLKPPRSLREWLIQLAVVAILYTIPAFTAWNLLDSRRDEA